MNNSREKMLQTISKALKEKRKSYRLLQLPDTVRPEEIYIDKIDDNTTRFCTELNNAGGESRICNSEADVIDHLNRFCIENNIEKIICFDEKLTMFSNKSIFENPGNIQELKETEAVLAECEFGVARTGSIMVSSKLPSGRRMHVFPPVLMFYIRRSQISAELEDVYKAMAAKYGRRLPSMMTLITGPGRTADIEKTLIIGAHGPKRIIVFIRNDE